MIFNLFSKKEKTPKNAGQNSVSEEVPCKNNRWMEKYDIKEPDLDFVYRKDAPFRDVQYSPKRYVLDDGVWKQKEPSDSGKATLMFTGDITCFDKQFEAAKTADGYDFTYVFDQMKPVFKQADLAVGNIETQIVPDAPYRSEKIVIEENFYCNAPLEFLDAIRSSGIDVLTNANNHDIDIGSIGVGETIDSLEKFGFIHTGTFKYERKRYEIFDVNGIRIAITAFATDHNALTCNITPEGIKYMLNDYTREAAQVIYDQAKAEGAEIVIPCMHWGKENWREVYKDQYQFAEELFDIGYDCIIGSHPHVLQKITYMEKDGRRMPIYYSLGNYVSQNFDNIKSRSIIACIRLERTGDGIALDCTYIPIATVEQYKEKGFVVLPLRSDTKSKKNQRRLKRLLTSVGTEMPSTDEYVSKDHREDIVKKEPKKKPEVIKLDENTEYPFDYTDMHFNYTVFKDHVRVNGVYEEYKSVSCTIPENVLGLPVTESVEGIFEDNKNFKKIKSIGIPYISDRLCKNCELLEGFRMGMTATYVGEEAFENCTRLYSAVMKRSLKEIRSKAFKGCSNLKSVKLPPTVTSIADDAFEGCDRVVFYCGKGTYADAYAKEHGIKTAYMDIYGPKDDI